jgi:hypothetical protein
VKKLSLLKLSIIFINRRSHWLFVVRYGNFEDILSRIEEYEGGIEEMALGFKNFGCHVESDNTFVVREWAPGAQVHTGDI